MKSIEHNAASGKPRASSTHTRTVYLAGKIRKDCWRHAIVPGLRGADVEGSTKTLPTIAYGAVTNGPFFTSCDHGCSHGEGTHGVGDGCYAGPAFRQREVYERSLAAIREADWTFCWIDDVGAYGTAVEVGYARGLGKPVFLAMSERAPAILCSDMWFLFEGEKINFFRDVREAFQSAVSKLRANEPATPGDCDEIFG